MASYDSFTEDDGEEATYRNYSEQYPMERRASLANRRLVEKLADRACFIEASREKRCVHDRLGTKQKFMNGRIKSRFDFRSKQPNRISVHDRLGYMNRRNTFRRRDFRSGISPLLKDRLGSPKYGDNKNFKSNISPLLRYRLTSPKYGDDRNFRCGISPLLRDRLGSPNYRYRNFRSGITSFLRDRSESPDDDLRKNGQFNRKVVFQERSNFRRYQQPRDNIFVEVRDGHFQSDIGVGDLRVTIDRPRANPAGVFNFYRGVRYLDSEIFICVSQAPNIDELELIEDE